ncbi:MAG: DegT/DnrJ/EryC1/StrS family aminotransferase [Armatimonadota bacterium]
MMTWWPEDEAGVNAPRGGEYEYVKEVLDYGWHNTRSPGFNMRLEEAFAERYEVKYGIAHNSGTSTMHTALMAAGIGPGDEVIVPPITAVATAFVVLHQNAVPVFADIDEDTFEIDPASIREHITEHTRAIIPVALYGLAPDMDEIMDIADEYDLVVIEDCAQAFLSEYKGQLAGTFGDAASFSFQGSKHMTCGDGGLTITDDPDMAKGVRWGMSFAYSSLEAASSPSASPPKEVRMDPGFARHLALGWNYRLPELAAAAALAQLERLDSLVSWRRACADGYAEVIEGCDWLTPQKIPYHARHSYWCYTVRLDHEELTWHDLRDAIVQFGGDQVYGSWRPLYLEPAFEYERFYGRGCPNHCPLYEGESQAFEPGLCPVTERVQPRLFQFRTNYPRDRAERQFDALAKAIEHFDG